MVDIIGRSVESENGKQYNVLQSLNEGVFGRIYKVVASDNNETLAMKIFLNTHPNAMHTSWDIETEALKSARSTSDEMHIVKLIECGSLKEDDFPPPLSNKFIVMPLLGRSIYQTLNPQDEATVENLAFENSNIEHMGYQISVAMMHLQTLNILHLDLKPENVCFVKVNNQITAKRIVENRTLLTMEDTRVKLIDIGCCRFIDEKHEENEIDVEVQTQNYRSPEVFMGLGYSRKSDVWSFGCLLSEMYTGDLLFFGGVDDNSDEVQLDVMQSILRRSIPYWMMEKAYNEGSQKVIWTDYGFRYHKVNMNPIISTPQIYCNVRQFDVRGILLHELVLECLEMDPEDRPNFAEIMRHDFFNQRNGSITLD